MNIKKIAKEVCKNNAAKGFWPKDRNQGEALWLICTELSEMTEAHREGRNGSISDFEKALKMQSRFRYPKKQALEIKKDLFRKHVKDSVGDELADAFIRFCDCCAGFSLKIKEKDIMNRLKHLCEYMEIKNLGRDLLNIAGMVYRLNLRLDSGSQDVDSFVTIIFSRLMWIADQLNIPLKKHVQYKMWYNTTREKMHGKKY